MWMQAGSWVVNPTGGCTSTTVMIELYFLTDHYPSEFYWNVIDKCNANAVVASVSQGHYSLSSTRYHEEVCVPPGRYQIILYDTAHDGLCCAYGTGLFQGIIYRDVDQRWSTFFFGATEMSPEFGDPCGTTLPPPVISSGGGITNAETCTEHEERHGSKPLWGLCKFGRIALLSI